MSEMFYCSFVGEHFIICECGETFATEELLKEHFDKTHRNKIEKRTAYKCGACGKLFTTQKACAFHYQQTHMEEAEEEAPPSPPPPKEKKKYVNMKNIVCEVCGKRYASNAALRYHQRVHTGERPYQCSACPKRFTMPLFLQIHTRTHTGERPYECSQCPKAFSNKAALLRHDRVHTGVKPYECPKCGKTFTQSNSMKLHVNTVHLKMPAPYKSKNRKNKENNKVPRTPKVVLAPDTETREIHVQEEIVEEQLDVKSEMYQEEVYGIMKDGDILYVDGDVKSEILYEEVYEE